MYVELSAWSLKPHTAEGDELHLLIVWTPREQTITRKQKADDTSRVCLLRIYAFTQGIDVGVSLPTVSGVSCGA